MRGVFANPIPPPPSNPTRAQFFAWAQRTYAPGTHVKIGTWEEWSAGPFTSPSVSDPKVMVPADTRGSVVKVIDDPSGLGVVMQIRLYNARSYAFTEHQVDNELVGELWDELNHRGTDIVSRYIDSFSVLGKVIPLDDNWVSSPKPMSRYALPSSQKRTSRRMRPNPYYHATRGDLARKILEERKLRAFPSRKYEGRPAVFAGDMRDPAMADAAMNWADTKHSYHFGEHPEEENVLIEFDARDPDDRRGRSGLPDPSGDEAVWFEDVDLVNPRIVKRRRGEMKWNPAPPPPSDWSRLVHWIKKTFPTGTAARLREDRPAFSPSKHGHVFLPAGTKGRVVFTGSNIDEGGHEHWYLNEVELIFAPYPSYSIPDDAWLHIAWPEVWEVLEPLDDHWASTSKPIGRLNLPSSQKRTSRRLRPNTVPPPPTKHSPRGGRSQDYMDWLMRTFAPGDTVKLKRPLWGHWVDTMETVQAPAGSRVRVGATYPDGIMDIEADLPVQLLTSSSTRGFESFLEWSEIADYLEPLVDNWGALTVRSKRTSRPVQAGWARQARASRVKPNRRRTSRRKGRI